MKTCSRCTRLFDPDAKIDGPYAPLEDDADYLLWSPPGAMLVVGQPVIVKRSNGTKQLAGVGYFPPNGTMKAVECLEGGHIASMVEVGFIDAAVKDEMRKQFVFRGFDDTGKYQYFVHHAETMDDFKAMVAKIPGVTAEYIKQLRSMLSKTYTKANASSPAKEMWEALF